MNTKQFIYGDYRYEYFLVPQKRKTLSLTVRPDMTLLVKCPHEVTEEKVEIFLRKKWSWLNKQLRFFEKFERAFYEKEYVSGESFLYLGRQYQLIVKRSAEDKVSLTRGVLYIFTSQKVRDGEYNKKLIDRWYKGKIKKVFNERYFETTKLFDYKENPSFIIKKMNKRWGSYTNSGRILLNPRLIHASKDCIDYVIAHELCHVKYKNHDKRFYKLLDSKISNWEKVKEKLELRLG